MLNGRRVPQRDLEKPSEGRGEGGGRAYRDAVSGCVAAMHELSCNCGAAPQLLTTTVWVFGGMEAAMLMLLRVV